MPSSATATNVRRRVRYFVFCLCPICTKDQKNYAWTSGRPGHILASSPVPARTTRSERDGPGDNCCNEQHNVIGPRHQRRAAARRVSNGGNEADRTSRQGLETLMSCCDETTARVPDT